MSEQSLSLSQRASLPTEFDPQTAKKTDAKADALIAFARRIQDWPLLGEAVEKKMDDQAEFIQWWDENVKAAGRQTNNADRRYLSVADAETSTGIRQQQTSRWRRRLAERDKYKELLYGAAYKKAMGIADTTAAKWTGDPECYTPAEYIESARRVLGCIDLDPASNDIAQKTVAAAAWYGTDDESLARNWQGRVFLNPPYAYPLVRDFIEKLVKEIASGNTTGAILLTNNNTDTRWWHFAAANAQLICFTLGRINFYKADGRITQPTNGQTFFYFGEDATGFDAEFSRYGLIAGACDGLA